MPSFHLEFRFAPMRFRVVGAILEDGSPVDSILESFASIRGRLRPDGTIGVDVGITRMVGAAAVGKPRTGGVGGGGRKQFSLASGETVSMVLPPPQGRYGVAPQGPAGTSDPRA